MRKNKKSSAEAKAKIAVIMIAYNDAEILEALRDKHRRLLYSFDYVLLADNGSTDGTPQVAHPFITRLLWLEWKKSFSTLRNDAQEHALWWYPDIDYFLHVDADEEFTPELIGEVWRVAGNERPDVGYFPRRELMNDYALEALKKLGYPWKDPYPDVQGRLIKRGVRWGGAVVHEGIATTPGMKMFYADRYPILHHHDIGTRYPHRWKEYEERLGIPKERRTQP